MIFNQLKDFTVIDTETTGLSKYRRITEFAAIKFRNGHPISRYDILINPRIAIPMETVKINQIDDNMVKNAPTICEVSDDIYRILGDDILVAHNAKFDVEGLNNRLVQGLRNKWIDTLEIFKQTLTISSYSLSSISRHLGLEEIQTHRALDDCDMTVKCLSLIEKPYKINIHDELIAVGNYKCSDIKPTEFRCDTLNGVHCVITGSVDGVSRLDIHKAIVNHGGTIGTSVIIKTRYLITGDYGCGNSKLNKAQMKMRNNENIEIIDFHTFNEMFSLGL